MLVVGIQTSVGRDLQRRTMAGFADRLPDWRLSLRLYPWDDATAGLTDETSDVALLWLPVPRARTWSPTSYTAKNVGLCRCRTSGRGIGRCRARSVLRECGEVPFGGAVPAHA